MDDNNDEKDAYDGDRDNDDDDDDDDLGIGSLVSV